MVRAVIRRPSGLTITVEGTPAEIREVVASLEHKAGVPINSPGSGKRIRKGDSRGKVDAEVNAEVPSAIAQFSSDDIERLRELISAKKPDGGQQTALVLAFYHERVAKRGAISAPILEELWQASGARPIHRMWQAAIDAKNDHGWFKSHSVGKYLLTPVGAYFVEREMPKPSPPRRPKPSERGSASTQ